MGLVNGGEYLVKEIDCRKIFIPENFTDEHRQIGQTTEQFVTNEISPINGEIEAKNFELLKSSLKKCGELGLMMIEGPEKHGGLELDKVTSMLVSERSAYAKNFGVSYMAHTGIGMLPLVYYGTEEQKERYLGKLMTGEWAASYCLTEPGSGSDALGAKTTAVLSEDGTHYVLNGTKQFITNAGFADLFTVFAKVDKEHFTGFLVDRTSEGLELGPEEKKMGMHGTSTRQVIFNNVRVPTQNLLGEVGKGHKIAFNVLNIGRLKLGAFCVGQKKYALAEGARYANERKQFGLSISSFGAIREKLAEAMAMTFASETVVYRLAGMIDDRLVTLEKNDPDYYVQYLKAIEEYAAECAIVKVFCTESSSDVIDEMLQIHGGYGFIAEYPIEQLYRDERVQRIYEGTNEINRLLIPGLLLKKGIGVLSSQEELSDGNRTPEQALIKGMKTIYLQLADHALQKFGAKVTEEQEILLSLADAAILIFVLESVFLRAEKTAAEATPIKKERYRSVVTVSAFTMRQRFINATEQCAIFLEEPVLLELSKSCPTLNFSTLLSAKRHLADAVSETEKYTF